MSLRKLAVTGAAVPAVAVTGAALVAAVAAGGSVTGTTYSQESAGYTAHGGGWQFRDVSTTFTMPSKAQLIADHAISPDLSYGVELTTGKQTIVLQVGVGSGGGDVGTIQYYSDGTTGGGDSYLGSAEPGSKTFLELHYERPTGKINYYVHDSSGYESGSFPAWTSKSRGGGSFTTAFVGAQFFTSSPYTPGAPINRPARDTRLFQAAVVHVISYNGTSGSMDTTKWPSQQTIYGTSQHNTEVNAPAIYDSGQTYGLWARH